MPASSVTRHSLQDDRRALKRGLWRKAKWLNRQEFVVVGWSDLEGTRPHLGALLLGYFTDDGKLTYAGRVGTGMPVKVLADLRRRPLQDTAS
jgi:ATP-dependent DNA ligase